jgi:gamma-glutamyltranspeptidase/glutathione hydrolase
MERGGGIISLRDLRDYRAKIRRPIHGTFRSYDVYGPPPPSSGGIVLIQMLNVLEQFDLRQRGRLSPDSCHVLIETMRRAYLDRARHLGDRDFVTIPQHLTSKAYAAKLARQIDRRRATPSDTLAPEIPLAEEAPSTTHFSVIDDNGMAVSNTYTLERSYGARVMVRDQGFLLNNEMGDFNWVPGRTDRSGRIGTRPNQIAPGKRMLSSQSPTMVLHRGEPFLLVGSPGGRTIINTVLCTILNVVEFEMDLPAAIAAPRWHHQWLPDRARFEGVETREHRQLVEELKKRGHEFAPPRPQGDAHCILVRPGTGDYVGVADTRISGKAVAVERKDER